MGCSGLLILLLGSMPAHGLSDGTSEYHTISSLLDKKNAEVIQRDYHSQTEITSSTEAKTGCVPIGNDEVSQIIVPRKNEINPEEEAKFAFDGDIHTKWLDYNGAAKGSWFRVDLKSPQIVSKYGIVSANDVPARDPSSWTVEGRASVLDDWIVLDSRSSEKFDSRLQRQTFAIEKPKNLQQYRINITSVFDNTTANELQISEFQLWFGSECSDPCCGKDCGYGQCKDGVCHCDSSHWGSACDKVVTEYRLLPSRKFVNSILVQYDALTVQECQTRCTMDWGNMCIGVTIDHKNKQCRLHRGDNADLQSQMDSDAYISILPAVM